MHVWHADDTKVYLDIEIGKMFADAPYVAAVVVNTEDSLQGYEIH